MLPARRQASRHSPSCGLRRSAAPQRAPFGNAAGVAATSDSLVKLPPVARHAHRRSPDAEVARVPRPWPRCGSHRVRGSRFAEGPAEPLCSAASEADRTTVLSMAPKVRQLLNRVRHAPARTLPVPVAAFCGIRISPRSHAFRDQDRCVEEMAIPPTSQWGSPEFVIMSASVPNRPPLRAMAQSRCPRLCARSPAE